MIHLVSLRKPRGGLVRANFGKAIKYAYEVELYVTNKTILNDRGRQIRCTRESG
jgi:hypothetical protein